MQTIKLTREQIDALNPQSIVVAEWTGSDDIFTRNGADLMEETGKTSVSEAIETTLKDTSGNSFDILVVHNSTIVAVSYF